MFIRIVFAVFICVGIAKSTVYAQGREGAVYNPNEKVDSSKRSISAVAFGNIGRDSLVVDYYSPGVRGRIIWGGLVPYGDVWVTGAHSATTLHVNRAVIIGGKKIPAGSYAFFTIPAPEQWTLIINRNFDQHLADDYNAAEDVVRVQVTPETAPHLERLQYFVLPQASRVMHLVMHWEKKKVTLPVQFAD